MVPRRFLVLFVLSISVIAGASAQSQQLVLPVVVNSDLKGPFAWATSVSLLNQGDAPVVVTLESYRDDGAPVKALRPIPGGFPSTATLTVTVASGGSERVIMELDPSELGSLHTGWIRIVYSGPAVIRAASDLSLLRRGVGYPEGRFGFEIVTVARTPAFQPATSFRALASGDFVLERPYRMSAYAIVNPSRTQSANVDILLDDWGFPTVPSTYIPTKVPFRRMGPKTLVIPPGGRVALFLSELFPETIPRVSIPITPSIHLFSGVFRITSDTPVAVGALEFFFPEGTFSSGTVLVQ